jgi:hypothetical protein
MDGWIEKLRGQIDRHADGQKNGWMNGQTNRQLGGQVSGWMGGRKDMLTAVYTCTTSLYLHIFVGLMVNQDESIFVVICLKNMYFYNKYISVVITLLIKYITFTICIVIPHRIC